MIFKNVVDQKLVTFCAVSLQFQFFESIIIIANDFL